jgi:hypothetical protein
VEIAVKRGAGADLGDGNALNLGDQADDEVAHVSNGALRT